jgi:hypothetical protein
MWSGIVTTEESVPGTFPWMIPRPFFIEIGQNLFDKELTIECF